MKTTLLFASGLAFLGCSSSSTNGDGAGAGGIPQGPTTFVMKEHVPASSEAFKCKYVQMPPTDGYIVGGQHQYTVGSHHLLLYRTDLTAIPAGGDVVQDCYEGSSDMMSHIRGVIYPAETPHASYAMPDGVGLPYKGGEVLLFQTHYLNANGTDLDAEADVYLATKNDGITQTASLLFFYDPFIDVPVGGRGRAGMRCPIPQDVTLLAFGSHYHARGVGYQAYVDLPGQPRSTTPFYTSNDWANPNISYGQSLQVPAGSHIRYYCDYDNTSGTREYVQGMSADTNEMCMFVALYYPAMTDLDDDCELRDEWGTGATTCSATLSCLQACPPGTNDQSTGEFTPCVQKCMVGSCPAAAAPLRDALGCISAKCSAQCGSGGASCTACVTQNCATEYSACAAAACDAP